MEWTKLTRVKEAPEHGWMLAYLRNEVLFGRYASLEEVRASIGTGELLELHLFDKKKEYRCMASQSMRYKSGIVETVADFEENSAQTTYAEDMYLEEKYSELGKKIRLLNHLKYDDNGMLEVDNYRLVMEVE